MNAYELANELEGFGYLNSDDGLHFCPFQAQVDMLRQQQAEIKALKLKKVTEGEILNIYLCLTNGNKDLDLFEFAEEILKKAKK